MRRIIFWLIASFPIGLFLLIIARYSLNVPWFDDFDPFPDFLREWQRTTDFASYIKLLFKPNNEHRMVFGKLAALGYFWLFGTLNFTFLHWAGTFFTLGTFAIFIRAIRQDNIPWAYLLPFPFLLFQLQYHMTSLWAITGLQHQPVVFFVCLTSYLLAQKRFAWALLTGLCANFAMSNGIFVWPAGFVILFLQGNYRWLGSWLLAGIVAVFLYFYGMQTLNNESSFGYFLQHPHETFFGFFTFVGGLFDFFPDRSTFERSVLPTIFGMVMTSWLGIVVVRLWRLYKKHALAPNTLLLFLIGVSTYLLANATIIAFLRPRFGYFVMLVSNYKIYPALFMMVSYGFYLGLFPLKRKWLNAALGFSILVWGLSFLHYWPTVSERRKTLLAFAYNQQHNGFGLGLTPNSSAALYVDTLMKYHVNNMTYHYPTDLAPALKAIQADTSLKIKPVITKQEEGLSIFTDDFSYDSGFDVALYAFLRSDSRNYLFKLEPNLYKGRNWFRRYDGGSLVLIPNEAIAAGKYSLGFVYVKQGQAKAMIYQPIEWP
ncbi:hypothetical protein [Runella salmonicolor]|uniref:4-amino-4-deoxy-L-arabinose transferase n=1 Tax=Runella salmonicolor TaxID=2950278 RepID=A0ABT1FM69_9BACT|nr:hypothetical protein [Runella salmonicolor]MCP1382595.1 hypothetical protein [Runella salmonicolor]